MLVRKYIQDNIPYNLYSSLYNAMHSFSANISMIAYLYGPIGFLIFINFVLFLLTTVALYRASKDTLAVRKREATQKYI